MNWSRVSTVIKFLLVTIVFIVIIAPEWPAFRNERRHLDTLVGLRQFDFLMWGANAMLQKTNAQASNGHRYLSPAQRQESVLAYLDLLNEVGVLQSQLKQVYVMTSEMERGELGPDLELELFARREELERLQPVAEAIVEEQVAAVLADAGFSTLGSPFPPVKMHMTPLPLVLVVSPREEIRQIYSIPLTPGLTAAEQDELERLVREELDRSALVVPIGGMGMYPAMIIETTNINFLADVVAHEWAHHWLTLRPLGMSYLASPEMRTMNETVASIVGTEIGAAVIERFYPQFVPPEQVTTEESARAPEPEPDPEAPPPFDFRAEMAETRVTADRLLAQGKIEEAEAYMEERRAMFVTNGYPIRKLNQAYFAFYGAYADTPGATGTDPVGPALLQLRENSSSLYDFMRTVAMVNSFAELQALADVAP
jgi:hypothetical protein